MLQSNVCEPKTKGCSQMCTDSSVADHNKIECNLLRIIPSDFFARKNNPCMVHIICKLDTFEWIARWKNSCQEFNFQMVSKLMTHFRHFSCRQLNAINDVTCPMNHTFWAIKYDSSLKCKRIPEKFPELTGWNWTSNDLRRWKSATVTLNEILKMNF